MADAIRFRWLAAQRFTHLSLERNDHALSYQSAAEHIDNAPEDAFIEVPQEILQQMREANCIWHLQIYPNTPVGFHEWYGPTAEFVIDQAMQFFATNSTEVPHVDCPTKPTP